MWSEVHSGRWCVHSWFRAKGRKQCPSHDFKVQVRQRETHGCVQARAWQQCLRGGLGIWQYAAPTICGHEHGKLLVVSRQEHDAIVLTMSKPNFPRLKGTRKSPPTNRAKLLVTLPACFGLPVDVSQHYSQPLAPPVLSLLFSTDRNKSVICFTERNGDTEIFPSWWKGQKQNPWVPTRTL